MASGRTVAEIWRFFSFLNGSHPPSWISCAQIWTIREEYLVVFITVQNLVGIDAVVSMICKV